MTKIKIGGIRIMFLMVAIVLAPQSFSEDKYYFNVGFANYDFESDVAGIGVDHNIFFVSAGTEIHPNFDVEVKYGLGDGEERYSGIGASEDIESIFQTSLIAKSKFYDSLEGFVKIGYTAIDDTTQYDGVITGVASDTAGRTIDDDHNDFTYGIGFKYQISDNNKIRFDYESIDVNSGDLSSYGIFYERVF